MIAVTVTLHDAATGKAKRLGLIEIINTGLHPLRPMCGHYVVRMDGREATVQDHDRAEGWLPLLRRALEELDRPRAARRSHASAR